MWSEKWCIVRTHHGFNGRKDCTTTSTSTENDDVLMASSFRLYLDALCRDGSTVVVVRCSTPYLSPRAKRESSSAVLRT